MKVDQIGNNDICRAATGNALMCDFVKEAAALPLVYDAYILCYGDCSVNFLMSQREEKVFAEKTHPEDCFLLFPRAMLCG